MSRGIFYFLFFQLCAVIFFVLKPMNIGDLSIWVALGQDSIDQFKIVRADTYTITATKEMVYPFFLSVIYGLFYKLIGLKWLAFLHALVPATWVLIWYKYILGHESVYRSKLDVWNLQTLVVIAGALLGTSLIFVPRPALVATLTLLVSYLILIKNRDKSFSKNLILQMAAISILWVNIHGSFLLLPAMIFWQCGQHIVEKNWTLLKNRILLGAVVALAALANPFTWKIFSYTFETAMISKARGLDEWFAPHLFYYPFASFYFFIFSAALVFLILSKTKSKQDFIRIIFDPYTLLWVLGFFAIRNTFVSYILLPIFIFSNYRAILFAQKIVTASAVSKTINASVVAILMGLILLLSPFFKHRLGAYLPPQFTGVLDSNSYSEMAYDYLRNNRGSIFNDWAYGSGLALLQKNQYLIDTRNIIFSNEVNRQYDEFLAAPEKGFSAIDKYGFKFYLINQKHKNLVSWLETSGHYQLVLKDGPTLLFQKMN